MPTTQNSAEPVLGIIGGSGLYELEGLSNIEEVEVQTPFGAPSSPLITGRLGQTRLIFIPRHGRDHAIPPQCVNYRANIIALKLAGAEQVLSVSAVGSMKPSIEPGEFVIVDQFIDRTRHRPDSFFDEVGVVAHVGFAEPIDAGLADALHAATQASELSAKKGGTYLCVEGPQFSTRAESELYRTWGVDVIGMTNLPEARLAREAELPYASLAMVTDYDCWHEEHESVSVEAILEVMQRNAKNAKRVIQHLCERLPDPQQSPASSALSSAIVTDLSTLSSAARTRLSPLLNKYY